MTLFDLCSTHIARMIPTPIKSILTFLAISASLAVILTPNR